MKISEMFNKTVASVVALGKRVDKFEKDHFGDLDLAMDRLVDKAKPTAQKVAEATKSVAKKVGPTAGNILSACGEKLSKAGNSLKN